MLPHKRTNRKRLIKERPLSLSDYGTRPEERSITDLLNQGVVNLDKPMGPTSHQVTAWVRDILGIEKAGHSGTLDPRVTGLLPIALGDATRALQALLIGRKEYVGIMRLHGDLPKKDLERVFQEFTGKIYQTPPVRSAVKRELRIREIYYSELLEIKERLVLFKVGCESGTYIRTLCHDVGDALGTGAHMQELRRTKTGCFTEVDSATLHDLKDAYVTWQEKDDDTQIRKIIQPMERLLDHLPKIIVKDSAVDAICHGAALAVPGILELDSGIEKGDAVALMSSKGEAIALGKTLMDEDNIGKKVDGMAVKIARILMEPGTYPRMWKSKDKIKN